METPSPSQQIDAIIATTDGWRGRRLSELRSLILDTLPDAVEEVKWKKPSRPEGVPVWSRSGIVCVGECLKNAVRLTFPKGALVNDPTGIFNARLVGDSVRAVDFAEGAPLPATALAALIRAAASLNAERGAGR